MWIDISQPVSGDLAVFPGDTPFTSSRLYSIDNGDAVTVHQIEMSPHTGTHVDAPLHTEYSGVSIEQLRPDRWIGPAEVVECLGEGPVRENEVNLANLTTNRLLIRTQTRNDPTQWSPPYRFLSAEFVHAAADAGIVLIGIDTPSVDPVESKELPAHHALFKHGIVNIENLLLEGVSPGIYFVNAAPLPLKGIDASPVRALLCSIESLLHSLSSATRDR